MRWSRFGNGYSPEAISAVEEIEIMMRFVAGCAPRPAAAITYDISDAAPPCRNQPMLEH
jgi:hypothetical protein